MRVALGTASEELNRFALSRLIARSSRSRAPRARALDQPMPSASPTRPVGFDGWPRLPRMLARDRDDRMALESTVWGGRERYAASAQRPT